MQHNEETAAAIAKAIQDCNEGWQKRFSTASSDLALRKWCVEQSAHVIEAVMRNLPVKGDNNVNVDPAQIARSLHKFIVEPFVIKDDA